MGDALTTPIYRAPTYSKKSGSQMHLKAKIAFLGCQGPWLQVSHQYNDVTTVGWGSPENQCPNSVMNGHKSNKGERTGVEDEGNR
jgi:hypothetical protein